MFSTTSFGQGYKAQPQQDHSSIPSLNVIKVAAVQVDEHRFLASMSLSTLLDLTVDPIVTEKTSEREKDRTVAETYEIRKLTQREFVATKLKNVAPFAGYLKSVILGGGDGLAPAPKLLCLEDLFIEVLGDGFVAIGFPVGTSLVAFDGETQLAAWHRLKKTGLTSEQWRQLKHIKIPVDLSYKRSTGWARQAWHDVNVNGSKPTLALSLAMDCRDPYNQLAAQIEQQSTFFAGKINKIKRQVKPEDGWITLATFRASIFALAKGLSSLAQGAKSPGKIPSEVDLDNIAKTASLWFEMLAIHFRKLLDDEFSVVRSPSVFICLGAMGHELLTATSSRDLELRASELIKSLESINWTKGTHWDGILGKIREKINKKTGLVSPMLVIGGPKETCYTVLKAFTERDCEEFRRIRKV